MVTSQAGYDESGIAGAEETIGDLCSSIFGAAASPNRHPILQGSGADFSAVVVVINSI